MQKLTNFSKAKRLQQIIPKEAKDPSNTIQRNYPLDAKYSNLIKALKINLLELVIPHFLTSCCPFTCLLSVFYPAIFSTFLQFISQYLTVYFPAFNFCLYLSIYSFILQIFYLFIPQILSLQISISIPTFLSVYSLNFSLFIFSLYTSFKTEKSRRFRRNFGREVTLKYLIWFQRDNFYFFYFYLSFSYYFILSCLFLTFYFTLFTLSLFLFYIFVFSFYYLFYLCVIKF